MMETLTDDPRPPPASGRYHVSQALRAHDAPVEAAEAAAGTAAQLLEETLASVRRALQNLRFGQIAVTVHEGRVVQIDVTEKTRLRPG
jgi:hypothetical protein